MMCMSILFFCIYAAYILINFKHRSYHFKDFSCTGYVFEYKRYLRVYALMLVSVSMVNNTVTIKMVWIVMGKLYTLSQNSCSASFIATLLLL